jgi:hypothetical protein
MANKSELVHYLDQHVFDPILRADVRQHPEQKKKELEDVQRRTATEKDRYHHYDSAEKVVQMYKDDLSSEHARPVNKKVKELNLPILADVKDEFLKLAGEAS